MNDKKENNFNEKIISLDNPKSVEIKESKFLLNSFYLIDAMELIRERVTEIKEYKCPNKDYEREYIDLKMHDMIMIVGRRGSGKTTFLMNLRKKIKKDKELQKDIKVLDIIDPTLLHGNSDILLLILAGVYTKLSNDFKKRDNRTNKKNEFKEIKEKLQNLHRTINLANKFKQDEDLEEDNYERLHGLHKGLEIDKDLHVFFKLVCKYYEVRALVLPIDDIDMDFKYGYKVFDTIRKYLATPRVIPIASMDLNQAHAVIKKEQYGYFGYEAYTSKFDIKEDSELKFLRKLPEEFLTKISLPTRRIILPDMLSIFENYVKSKNQYEQIEDNNEKKDSAFRYIFFEFKNHDKIRFKLELEDIVKYYINIVYDSNMDANYRLKKISSSDYLGNKSVRSFFEDIRSFLDCIVYDKGKHIFNNASLIKRYLPYSTIKYKTKYDAVLGLWSKYIKLTNSQISKKVHLFTNVSRAYQISGKDHDNTIKTKTYMRLFLQEFFIDKITIEIQPYCKKFYKINSISKDINIAGAMELALRTFIPQYLFEDIYKNNYKDMANVNLKEFELFATDDLKVISHKLSVMNIRLLNKFNNTNIMGGIKLSGNEYDNFPDISSFFLTESSDDLTYNYLSSFKVIAETIELLQSKSDLEMKKIIKKYFTFKKSVSNNYKKKLNQEYDRINAVVSKIKNIINYKNISFGLNELSLFSNKFINNILIIIKLNKIIRNSEDMQLTVERLTVELNEKLLNINYEINKNKKEESYVLDKIKEQNKLESLKKIAYLHQQKEDILEQLKDLEDKRLNIKKDQMLEDALILSKQKEFFIYLTSFFNHFLIILYKSLEEKEDFIFEVVDESFIQYGISRYEKKAKWNLKLPQGHHPLFKNIQIIKGTNEMSDIIDLVEKAFQCISQQIFENTFE